MIVPDLLRTQAARTPDQAALIVDGIAELRYAEWEAASNRLARALVARGVQRGDRVGLLYANASAHRFAIAYMAVHKAGAVNVPLNCRLALRELRAVVAHSGARALLYGEAEAGLADALVKPTASIDVVLDPVAQEANDHSGEYFQVLRTDDDLADILYTSGTTGMPKGVACDHGNVTFQTSQSASAYFRGATFLHAVPVFTFAGAHAMMLIPLRGGMTTVVQPRFDPARYLALIDERKVAMAFAVPSMVLLMLRRGGPPRSSLRLLLYGTAPMPPSAIARLPELFPNAMLVNMYGLTESGTAVCSLPPYEAHRRPTSVGKPVPPAEVRVVGADGEVCPPGEPGEVCMRSPARTRRYFRDDAATRATWTTDGWLRTGDIGYLDADGYLYLVDRKTDLIVRGGFNIAAAEVEHVLLEHPDVREAAVIGVPHPVLGEAVAAFVVGSAAPEVLEAFCRERLADYKVPRRFTFVDALPRNALGKVLKRELRTLPIDHEISVDGASVFVRERGTGPAIVFGHSLGFDGDMWRAQVQALSDRFRTLAIDFRGHGRTTCAARFTLDDLADDVVHVLDMLGIERAVYCGLSLGGMVGMRLALRHPDRVTALALLNTSAEPEEPARRRMFEAYNESTRGRTPDAEGAALMMSLMFSREFVAAHAELAKLHHAKLLRPDFGDGRYYAARAVLARDDLRGDLPAIRVPTLVVGSTGDTAVPLVHARAIAAAIPNATLAILDGGHMSAVERADDVTRALGVLLAASEGTCP